MKNTILFILIAFSLVSCNNKQKKAELIRQGNTKIMANQKMVVQQNETDKTETVPTSEVVEKKLIKNGSISFQTEDLSATANQIKTLVKANQGYISSNRTYKYGDKTTNSLTVRIPSKKFDLLLSEISKGVKKFDEKSIRISDVTTQFLDIQSRLKNKKALEQRYLQILKKAKSVQEILAVEKELGKLREAIDAKEGQLKYLQNQVSFSTLNITFYKQVAGSESSFGSKISNAFKGGFENIKTFFIGIINFWPFILIFSLVFYFFIRNRRKKTRSIQ